MCIKRVNGVKSMLCLISNVPQCFPAATSFDSAAGKLSASAHELRETDEERERGMLGVE